MPRGVRISATWPIASILRLSPSKKAPYFPLSCAGFGAFHRLSPSCRSARNPSFQRTAALLPGLAVKVPLALSQALPCGATVLAEGTAEHHGATLIAASGFGEIMFRRAILRCA